MAYILLPAKNSDRVAYKYLWFCYHTACTRKVWWLHAKCQICRLVGENIYEDHTASHNRHFYQKHPAESSEHRNANACPQELLKQGVYPTGNRNGIIHCMNCPLCDEGQLKYWTCRLLKNRVNRPAKLSFFYELVCHLIKDIFRDQNSQNNFFELKCYTTLISCWFKSPTVRYS